MSAYTASGNNYPHPQAQPHPSLQSPAGGASDPLSHQHHGLPAGQPYPFDPQPQPQHLQHQQPSYNGHLNGHGEEAQPGASATLGGHDAQKSNRLRKACDSCSIRKVKCDESGPPCRACAALDIPCKWDRPSRRRGPPNKHAEAIKKRRLESPSAGGFSSPTSPDNVAATLASFSSHAVLSAESICPFPTLELLVDDFFAYIHPLAPFPHEPSFRAAFNNREDLNNPPFLALLASMVGILVASFPRRPQLHFKAQHREQLFPNSISLVERCHKVAVEARGAGYLDKELSVYDAATSYFLGLAAAHTFNWRQCRLYFGETLNITRVLGAHKLKDPGFLAGGLPGTFGAENGRFDGQAEPVDYIRQEIGRRLFWIMFVGIRSMQQLGATFGELLIAPPTPNEPYPPLPMEVDDSYIYVDHVEPQPPGTISNITGFNLGIQIYLTCTPLATMEMAYGIDEVFDWNRQKRTLGECLRAVKRVLETAPRELMLQPGSQLGEFGLSDRPYFPPLTNYPGIRSNGEEMRQWAQDNPAARRNLQYEVQKANIYASQLGTRYYIIEKYWNLHDAYIQSRTDPLALSSPGLTASGLDGMLPKTGENNVEMVEGEVANERENIVKDVLRVLGSISQYNMEPNGGTFINKIRQIASKLIEAPQNRKGPLGLKAEESLSRFVDVLLKLERTSPAAFRSDLADVGDDEEEESRNWAELREYQTRFALLGGLINEL